MALVGNYRALRQPPTTVRAGAIREQTRGQQERVVQEPARAAAPPPANQRTLKEWFIDWLQSWFPFMPVI